MDEQIIAELKEVLLKIPEADIISALQSCFDEAANEDKEIWSTAISIMFGNTAPIDRNGVMLQKADRVYVYDALGNRFGGEYLILKLEAKIDHYLILTDFSSDWIFSTLLEKI